jgi:hypothetical protein
MSCKFSKFVSRAEKTICSGVVGPDPSLKRPARCSCEAPHFLRSPEQIAVTALPLQAKALHLLWPCSKSAFLVAAQRRTWNDAAKF